MSQVDFEISTSDANTGATMRAAINAALQALAGSNSGATAPGTTYPYQFWADTANDLLKQRNAANSGWINICYLSAGGAVGGGAKTIPLLDASGNLLVGATNGSYHTFEKNSSGSAVLRVANTANNTLDISVISDLGSNCNNTSAVHFYARTNGADKALIRGNGDLQNANNAYGAISDIKLKENISVARSYLDDLCGVNVVRYSLKSDNSDHATHLGVIAQELEQIFPGMIEVSKDTAERPSGKYEQIEIAPAVMDGEIVITPAVYADDETKPIMERYETGEVTKGVKYSVFVPMLITAVQELRAKSDALDARIAALEAA